MSKFITFILLILAFAFTMGAEDLDLDSVPHFVFSNETSLTAATTKWTLQIPAQSTKRAYIVRVTVWCEVECEVIQSLNGSTPTGSAVAVSMVPLNLPDATPATVFYRNSDSTGGSSLAAITIPAKTTFPLYSRMVLAKGKATDQIYTVAIGTAITGKVRIHGIVAEKTR